jgi:hypothetical protein
MLRTSKTSAWVKVYFPETPIRDTLKEKQERNHCLLILQKWTVNHNWPSDILFLVLLVKCQSISRILCEEPLSATGVFAVAAVVVVVVDSHIGKCRLESNEVSAGISNTFGLR